MTEKAPPCFTTRLQVCEEENRPRVWRTTSTLVYRSVVADATITVPADFITDFASVPKTPIAWWLFGGHGHRAAVIHDWLYQRQVITEVIITREMADAVFDEALATMGIATWRRVPMVRAVRMWGRRAWDTGPVRFAILNPLWQGQEQTTGHITPRREILLAEGPPDVVNL